ncbi:Lrp/AsnC family leucine-responsive transcriptional regulator [Lachnospiraceae bacterium PF1-21]|uniref:Lrp/AsnC family transcriptional regulator n=1 Tax=Ohessyouella blattaphilus TaxID=2949333 RepID=A0ABT1EH02_9FIRM|nr:Lrp/AsnC family transcriptional regulator [Ohessyouella blattaphilus]MCP1109973.1 Lrp/AsnC family transcriptional regulator [Ohessyouella blattaphilus]MCR8563367.1 Lrp/AsnC family transcriptional regulator [Ohessyouella blattaphilus]
MDKVDYQILEILKSNGRERASEISKEVHLTVSTVIERIRKLEQTGVIKGYTVITDDPQVGNDVTVVIEISLEHPKYEDAFIESINSHPNIISCYYLTGEFDYMLKITCRSSQHLEEIHRWIKDQPGVRKTRTHYVLRTVKNIYTSLPEEDTLQDKRK